MLKLLLGLGLCAFVLAAAEDQAVAPSCSLVPGWTQDGGARYYTTENLFEYMDGNSEGYFSYDFQNMHGVTCKQGETTFIIDISDMGSPDNAYGWFSSTRDLREPAYPAGMGGQIVPRRLIFAKGKYYVEIAANPEGDFTAALKQWAAALDKLVPGSTSPPAALAWFPTEKQQTLKLAPQSVLGLRILKRGYVAQYDYGKAFVVLEESPQSAGATMQSLRQRFGDTSPVKLGEDGFQATDKYLGRMCFVRTGRYIAGYAISADGVDPVGLTAALVQKIGR
ncbi:MAG: hypothetical protein P4L56_25935 [Candidatus Sulfopaludibacter sp.]|nr:hypothetical protein [Candidatus Sulfopaludibacter sp.]